MLESYYKLADGRMFVIRGVDRETSAELLALHGCTPRR